MHEVAAIQGAVRTALEYMHQAGAARVTRVQLAVAVSGHFTEEVVRHYFTVFTAGTPAKDATLTIIWLPATYQCLTCLQTFQSLQPAVEALCPECGETALEIEHRDTCAVSAIDVAIDETSRTSLPSALKLPLTSLKDYRLPGSSEELRSMRRIRSSWNRPGRSSRYSTKTVFPTTALRSTQAVWRRKVSFHEQVVPG
jgi:hydrogenase nickel insertion protein HypA